MTLKADADGVKPSLGSDAIVCKQRLADAAAHRPKPVPRKTTSEAVSVDLRNEFVGEGEAAAYGEGFGGDLKARRGLLALVFAAVNHAGNFANHVERKVVVAGDFFRRAKIFDVGLENAIENVVRRERILISLIGAKFG